jgi:hypothetical protein
MSKQPELGRKQGNLTNSSEGGAAKLIARHPFLSELRQPRNCNLDPNTILSSLVSVPQSGFGIGAQFQRKTLHRLVCRKYPKLVR